MWKVQNDSTPTHVVKSLRAKSVMFISASAFVRLRQPESSDFSCTWVIGVMRARMTIDNYIVLIMHALTMQPVIVRLGILIRPLVAVPLAMQLMASRDNNNILDFSTKVARATLNI